MSCLSFYLHHSLIFVHSLFGAFSDVSHSSHELEKTREDHTTHQGTTAAHVTPERGGRSEKATEKHGLPCSGCTAVRATARLVGTPLQTIPKTTFLPSPDHHHVVMTWKKPVKLVSTPAAHPPCRGTPGHLVRGLRTTLEHNARHNVLHAAELRLHHDLCLIHAGVPRHNAIPESTQVSCCSNNICHPDHTHLSHEDEESARVSRSFPSSKSVLAKRAGHSKISLWNLMLEHGRFVQCNFAALFFNACPTMLGVHVLGIGATCFPRHSTSVSPPGSPLAAPVTTAWSMRDLRRSVSAHTDPQFCAVVFLR